MTPMAAAAKRGYREVVCLLLQAGGDPNSKNKVNIYKVFVLTIGLLVNNTKRNTIN